MKSRPLIAGLSLPVFLASFGAVPASAQPCEWDGERTICPVKPQSSGESDNPPFGLQPGWLRDLFRSEPSGPTKKDVLKRDIQTFNSSLQPLYENSRSLEQLVSQRPPRSQAELDRRIDSVLATIWPEYRSKLLDYGLLRSQSAFYERDKARVRRAIQSLSEGVIGLRTEVPPLRVRAAETRQALAAATLMEGRLNSTALALINDRSSERLAIASLLVFVPNPRVTPSALDDRPAVTMVPGMSAPAPRFGLMAAGLAPASAEDRLPTNYGELTVAMPGPEAPRERKLAAMQMVGHDLHQLWFDVPPLRTKVAAAKSEHAALTGTRAQLSAEFGSLWSERSALSTQIADGQAKLADTESRMKVEARTIVTEVVADMALDRASAQIRERIARIAGAEGLLARIPSSGAEAILDLAKRGGSLLLPHKGHEKQWEAVVDIQEHTLNVLERTQGFMQEAARLAATGSPAEMQAHLDRVFASLNWQAYEYTRIAGMGVLPEESEASPIEEAFDKYLARLKQRQTGE